MFGRNSMMTMGDSHDFHPQNCYRLHVRVSVRRYCNGDSMPGAGHGTDSGGGINV